MKNTVNKLMKEFELSKEYRKLVEEMYKDALKQFGKGAYGMCRNVLAEFTGKSIYFTVQDVADITGKSSKEVVESIEEMKESGEIREGEHVFTVEKDKYIN
ncbi:hypothetical protein CLPU_3c00990 [Gottschalkia purinilytica]|uniref:Uncharacterized protein n=1 Tax=Gottschalkia purinilytica TaxID=1503 RepID=A0A0L0WCZ9_GOTPU|nr:hypothetical protein [Gottschalkia purinilytica]KNF09321.1 hypothetical protein CLPU_3c00990 [Gottschalkia purinilytica]